MRSTLTVDKQVFDNTMTRVRYMLETNYAPGTMSEEQMAYLQNDVYEGFSYFLEMICSNTVGGPSVEFILYEYLYGHYIRPENRDIVMNEVGHLFSHAASFIKPDLLNVIRQSEMVFQEVVDIKFVTSNLSPVGIFIVESESILNNTQPAVPDHIGRGLTHPTTQVYL